MKVPEVFTPIACPHCNCKLDRLGMQRVPLEGEATGYRVLIAGILNAHGLANLSKMLREWSRS